MNPTKKPTATALRAWPHRRFYAVEVECPYCALTHTHGWDGPGHPGGYWEPECTQNTATLSTTKDYHILIPNDLKVEKR